MLQAKYKTTHLATLQCRAGLLLLCAFAMRILVLIPIPHDKLWTSHAVYQARKQSVLEQFQKRPVAGQLTSGPQIITVIMTTGSVFFFFTTDLIYTISKLKRFVVMRQVYNGDHCILCLVIFIEFKKKIIKVDD